MNFQPVLPGRWLLLLAAHISLAGVAAEFHVATTGNDSNSGTADRPFRTIQHAADLAHPGDVITVHAGIYRERIAPPRGGTSESKRITFQAAPGERVAIKGSETITNWLPVQGEIWKAVLPNSFFGAYNPYSDLIHGNWFNSKGRTHHTGAVYLDGEWLVEAATLDLVLKSAPTNMYWFGLVDATNTTIWAQFNGTNPNEHRVEINVRRAVFYPQKTGVNFITVRGFILRDAAAQWAPPTAEQVGIIGPHWSKGWIIESNVISHSTCSGISLGKYGDEWDNKGESVDGYTATIRRALTNGWNAKTIGHHTVRHNEIAHCEQAGIVGSFGASFSTVSGNVIHDIHVRRLFSGPEVGGIKFHGGVDVIISSNHIFHTFGSAAIWLDWMGQGARITGNLLNDNSRDLFLEVDHGPILVDNNLFLSGQNVHSCSRGVAFVHNLFAGTFNVTGDGRKIPYLKPHDTSIAGFHDFQPGDDRFYNNIFGGKTDLRKYDTNNSSAWMSGNIFSQGAIPSAREPDALVLTNKLELALATGPDGCYLSFQGNPNWQATASRRLVTSKLLGKAQISGGGFEQPNGASLKLNTDYLGKRRLGSDLLPGPFADLEAWNAPILVWK